MSKLLLRVPEKTLSSPASFANRKQMSGLINEAMSKYGDYIKFASENSKIPMEIIVAFIVVESGVNPLAGGEGHITQGLMQWNRTFASSILSDEKRLGRMTPNEEKKLNEYDIFFTNDGRTRAITNADQKKPELNIIIGSIILGQLIDSIVDGKKSAKKWGTDENGNVRLDRIIAVYNAGAYGDTGKKARLGNYATPTDLANVVNSITSAYIKKIYGTNGVLDVATSDAKSAFKYA
jgi:hypothetical protein